MEARLTLLYFCSCLITEYHVCVQTSESKPANRALYLTPLIQKGETELARSMSSVKSKHFLDLKSHSGFITVNEEYASNLFFWFFPLHERRDTTPWIIWLQGGPGYTSLMGLFNVIGPLEIEHGTVKLRDVTWASNYSVLFIDNPVGAGFSFTEDDRGYPSDEDAVGDQLYIFLEQFIKMFPDLQRAPLFVAGESYAGKYVPALAIQIHRRMNNFRICLKGIILGNALIDPRNMMKYSSLCQEIGIVVDNDLKELQKLENQVVRLIDEKKMIDASNKFNETIEFIKKVSGVSIYNFMKSPSHEAPEFEHFVQRENVRSWIHVGNATFELNNQLVYKKMLPDIMNTTSLFVEELLNHYHVLIYSGQLDLILPYSLTKQAIELFQWNGSMEYRNAKRKRIRSSDGHVEAYKKSGGNLTEALIRHAGHMVPADNAPVIKYIVDRFIESAVR